MNYSFNSFADANPYDRVYRQTLKYGQKSSATTGSAYNVPQRYPSQQSIGAMSSASAFDIQMLPNPFEHSYSIPSAARDSRSIETVNKNLQTVDSRLDLARLPNPFRTESVDSYYNSPRSSDSQHTVGGSNINPFDLDTQNKYAFSVDSQVDIRLLPNVFNSQSQESLSNYVFSIPRGAVPANAALSSFTVNKRALSKDSEYDLHSLPNVFANNTNSAYEIRLRDYSPQSLEDLRNLPSFSKISLVDQNPTKDVDTAVEIPSQTTDMRYFPEAFSAPTMVPLCSGCNCGNNN